MVGVAVSVAVGPHHVVDRPRVVQIALSVSVAVRAAILVQRGRPGCTGAGVRLFARGKVSVPVVVRVPDLGGVVGEFIALVGGAVSISVRATEAV